VCLGAGAELPRLLEKEGGQYYFFRSIATSFFKKDLRGKRKESSRRDELHAGPEFIAVQLLSLLSYSFYDVRNPDS
jgi:hypothetical protein